MHTFPKKHGTYRPEATWLLYLYKENLLHKTKRPR